MANQVAHKKSIAAIHLNPSMFFIFFECLDQNLGDDKGCLQLKDEKLSIEIPFNICIRSWLWDRLCGLLISQKQCRSLMDSRDRRYNDIRCNLKIFPTTLSHGLEEGN